MARQWCHIVPCEPADSCTHRDSLAYDDPDDRMSAHELVPLTEDEIVVYGLEGRLSTRLVHVV